MISYSKPQTTMVPFQWPTEGIKVFRNYSDSQDQSVILSKVQDVDLANKIQHCQIGNFTNLRKGHANNSCTDKPSCDAWL